jgi:4-aminobutyrate aminotransferase
MKEEICMAGQKKEHVFEELSHPEAPKFVTDEVPGPKASDIFQKMLQWESPQRPAGTVIPLVAAEEKGSTIKDVDGNIFIDFAAGVGVKSTGSCHPKVVKAIQEQAPKMGHMIDAVTPLKAELVEIMRDTAPHDLKNNCFMSYFQSGTSAAESCVKQCKMISGKSQVVVFEGAYHGVFGHTNAMTTGEVYRQGYGSLMPGVHHLPYAYCYRCPFNMEYPKCDIECAKYVDYKLNTPYTGIDDVAAVIAESFQGEGGYLVPPKEWWPMIEKAAQKAGALCIADEVQSGFGRSGKLWACEHFDFNPDMITFGKGVGNDQPLAGVMTNSKYHDKLTPQSQPNTFTGNSIALAVAKTNYEIMLDPDTDLMGRALELGEYMQTRFKEAQKSIEQIGDIRGVGLWQAIELVKDPGTKEPTNPEFMGELLPAMFSKGLFTVPCGRHANVLRFMPPLTISKKLLDKALDIIIETLGEKKDSMAGK